MTYHPGRIARLPWIDASGCPPGSRRCTNTQAVCRAGDGYLAVVPPGWALDRSPGSRARSRTPPPSSPQPELSLPRWRGRCPQDGGGDVMSGAARPETRWALPWIDAPLPACAETWLARPVMDARQCGPCPPLPGVATQSPLVRPGSPVGFAVRLTC